MEKWEFLAAPWKCTYSEAVIYLTSDSKESLCYAEFQSCVLRDNKACCGILLLRFFRGRQQPRVLLIHRGLGDHFQKRYRFQEPLVRCPLLVSLIVNARLFLVTVSECCDCIRTYHSKASTHTCRSFERKISLNHYPLTHACQQQKQVRLL